MRVYLIIMGVLLALTALMSVGAFAMIALFVTLGLALPLIMAATPFAYGLCAFPAVALWREGGATRLMGLALSLALAAGLAVVPGMIGRQQADAEAGTICAIDRKPASPVAVTSLEIRRPRSNYTGLFRDGQPCGQECRSLLAAGRVGWVRVVMIEGQGRRQTTTSTRHALHRGSDCAVPGSQPSTTSQCILMTPDDGTPADLVVAFENRHPGRAGQGVTDLARLTQVETVTAALQRAGAPSEVYRQSTVHMTVPMMPTVLGPHLDVSSKNGIMLYTTKERFNRISLHQTLTDLGLLAPGASAPSALTVKPRSWRDGIDDDMTRELLAVLGLPQTERFNQEQARVVSDWIMHARQVKDWTPQLIELLRRIVRDRRIQSPTFFDQIFERQPAVTAALLPDIVELLEKNGVTSKLTPERQAAYTFSRLDPALLTPHGARILALLAKDHDLRQLLLPAVGRLGVDPLPYITPLEADLAAKVKGKFSQAHARIRAACHAEPRWSPQLIPALRAALAVEHPDPAKRTAKREREEFRRALVKTLAKLGDRETVEAELARLQTIDEKAATRLRERTGRDLATPALSTRLCQF